MGPGSCIVSWALEGVWCSGACRLYGIMGPGRCMVSTGVEDIWCHGAWQKYVVIEHGRYMISWSLVYDIMGLGRYMLS